MEEKRSHRRVTHRTEVTCTPEGGESFVAHSHDISLGGMFVETERNPEFGTKMTISLFLPGESEAFDLPCTVR